MSKARRANVILSISSNAVMTGSVRLTIDGGNNDKTSSMCCVNVDPIFNSRSIGKCLAKSIGLMTDDGSGRSSDRVCKREGNVVNVRSNADLLFIETSCSCVNWCIIVVGQTTKWLRRVSDNLKQVHPPYLSFVFNKRLPHDQSNKPPSAIAVIWANMSDGKCTKDMMRLSTVDQ